MQQDKIKIFYLIENLNAGGAEQLLLTTLKYLDHSKFYPTVYCISEKGEIAKEIEAQTGISVISLNKHCSLWNIGIILELIRIFLRQKPYILHTNLFYANYFGRIAAIFTRVPVVIITEHGTYSNFKRFYHYGIDFILSFFTTKIIAVSHAVKKYLLKYSLISPRKIVVIYNTIDFDKFNRVYGQDKFLVRKSLGFSNTDFIIGCVSNLVPWKGQFFLLQAFAEVVKAYPYTKLCLVGRDAIGFKNELEAFAKKRNLLEDVYFFGERQDIPEILKTFDVFVFPSLTEGLGISLLEAMYMGLATIASDTEGILEIIEDDKDGILTPSGNWQALAKKIKLLLEDKEKMRNLSYNAREKVKRYFAPDAFMQRLESFYGELGQI